MTERTRLLLLAAVTGAVAAALAARRPALPAPAAPADEIAGLAAWAFALACAGWLCGVALVCALALATRRRRVALGAARVAPRFVRRLVEMAVAGSVAVGPAVPAVAHAAPPVHPVAYDEPVVRAPAAVAHTRRTAPLAVASDEPVVRAPAAVAHPGTPPGAREATTARAVPSRHVVRPGESLWTIARDALAARGDRAPGEAAVAAYWRSVVEANRATLRSGNPNLVFPGEIVALPGSR